MLPGAPRLEAVTGGLDPAARSEAADRCATLLVRGAHGTDDEDVGMVSPGGSALVSTMPVSLTSNSMVPSW